jgi:hypothetical protein
MISHTHAEARKRGGAVVRGMGGKRRIDFEEFRRQPWEVQHTAPPPPPCPGPCLLSTGSHSAFSTPSSIPAPLGLFTTALDLLDPQAEFAPRLRQLREQQCTLNSKLNSQSRIPGLFLLINSRLLDIQEKGKGSKKRSPPVQPSARALLSANPYTPTSAVAHTVGTCCRARVAVRRCAAAATAGRIDGVLVPCEASCGRRDGGRGAQVARRRTSCVRWTPVPSNGRRRLDDV